jgi:hypothetical protein
MGGMMFQLAPEERRQEKMPSKNAAREKVLLVVIQFKMLSIPLESHPFALEVQLCISIRCQVHRLGLGYITPLGHDDCDQTRRKSLQNVLTICIRAALYYT